jgi:Xaa-Pro aminopeptidase
MGGKQSQFEDKVLPLRDQARVVKGWIGERLNTVLPELMKREGFDMWVICVREYNEGPLVMTMLPPPMLTARRRTILVFYRCEDGTVERLILARPGLEVYDLYQDEWRRGQESQWEALGRVVRERDPKVIGINCSETHQFADDLTYAEHQQLMAAFGLEYAQRTKWAERLVVGWLEHRSEAELQAYPGILQIAVGIVQEGLSGRVILPGVTSCDDAAWWIRQRTLDLGLDCWFMPYVKAQRRGTPGMLTGDSVIRQGDALHCDFGLQYLGLSTDTKQHAYCLLPGESDAPGGLKRLLAAGCRVQDILAEYVRPGRTGNEVLRLALARAAQEGIVTKVYGHPVGCHGHAAGPYIGLSDMQGGVPGTGDYEIHDSTSYSFELSVTAPIPEWDGQVVTLPIESDVVLTAGTVSYLPGRQSSFHLL